MLLHCSEADEGEEGEGEHVAALSDEELVAPSDDGTNPWLSGSNGENYIHQHAHTMCISHARIPPLHTYPTQGPKKL